MKRHLYTLNQEASNQKMHRIQRARSDSRIFIVVPYNSCKNAYPADIHDQIFSFADVRYDALLGKKVDKVLLDRQPHNINISEILYYLGYHGYVVEDYSYG